MKSSISYKTVNIVALLVCVASISAMEQPTTEFVSSEDMKELSQSIMMATGESDSSLKGSRGWFSGVSDWWYGLDTNVASELKEGTLTKDVVAQDKQLQKRAYDAISTALEKKRTENLCTLLNQLHKFEMLDSVAEQNESITRFLNAEINVVCGQKASAKLMDILTTMKATQLVVDSGLAVAINNVLNEQKERDIQAFKNMYQETQGLVANILERAEKGKERYKNPLIEAKDIVLMQKYLGGESAEVEAKQIKEELGLTNNEKELTALLKALKVFVDKK